MGYSTADHGLKVIPIRAEPALSKEQREIADLAYEFWTARCFRRHGSPEESLLQAVLEMSFRHGSPSRAGLFIVPKPNLQARTQSARVENLSEGRLRGKTQRYEH